MPTPAIFDARALLAPDEFTGVTATVQDNNPGMLVETAQRIVTETVAFVAAAARNPSAYIQPSAIVDEGWHALILNTAVYARLCDRLGLFIHHYPERPDTDRHDADATARTLLLMRDIGHTPDLELWTAPDDSRISVATKAEHTPKPGGCSPIQPLPRPPKPPQPQGAA